MNFDKKGYRKSATIFFIFHFRNCGNVAAELYVFWRALFLDGVKERSFDKSSDRPEAEFLPPAGAGDSGAVSTGAGAGAGVLGNFLPEPEFPE